MNNKIYTDGSYRDGKGTFAIDIYNDIQRVKEITAICDANSSCKWIKEDATIYPDTERKLKMLTTFLGQKYKFRYFNWMNKTAEEADLPVVQ